MEGVSTMPSLLGLALPLQQFRPWTPEQLELAAELMPCAYVVPLWGDQQPPEVRADQVAAVLALAARTGARLLLRACERDLSLWAPNDWAGECARRAGFFTTPVEMIPGNELNSPLASGSLAWAIGAGPSWLLRFSRRYRRLRRGERLHVPAPAPGAGGREAIAVWKACARVGVGKRFDVVDVHAYSDEQVRALPRAAHEALGLPVDLTAWNRADPDLVAAEVRANPWLWSACYAPPVGEASIEPAVLLAFDAAAGA